MPTGFEATLCSKDVVVNEVIAEFSFWVVLGQQSFEFGLSWVEGFQVGWGDRKDFSPVGAGLEWPSVLLR